MKYATKTVKADYISGSRRVELTTEFSSFEELKGVVAVHLDILNKFDVKEERIVVKTIARSSK